MLWRRIHNCVHRDRFSQGTMDLKDKARSCVLSMSDRLIDLSHLIHANPELGYQETQACQWLSGFLSDAGFEVENPICDLPTAFKARAGVGSLNIAICAEYDCLPEIGHACGHNLIAAMSVAAGIAISSIADDAELSVSV